MPILSAIGKPIADHNEYLPPTQSQNLNILSALIPNFSTSIRFVETATKWFWTSFSQPPWARNHLRAECALAIVSCVVKVLEAIINSVVSGSNFFKIVDS